MDGRAFLDSARHLLAAPCAPNWRSAAGRSYVALLNEAQAALERWGFPLPAGADVHAFVVGRFASTVLMDLIRVEVALRVLRDLTWEADHALGWPGHFADASKVSHQLFVAEGLIHL